ncbi:MAG: transketolase, partial [Rhodospirillales bacterium]
ATWRERLKRDLQGTSGLSELLDSRDDDSLHDLMTNLGGHDMECLLEAFHGVETDRPQCFLAYTIKGYKLPFAGHKDNHSGLMTPEQIARFRRTLGIAEGREWEPMAGLDMAKDDYERVLERVRARTRKKEDSWAPVIPASGIETPDGDTLSTQEAFGRVMTALGRQDNEFTQRIVTTSPDVTVSTGLGGWVNRRKLFQRREESDVFKDERIPSTFRWEKSPQGRHVELGIAENNFFLLLAELGLSEHLFGARLLPVGTLYDMFIARGLDALNYACYQDARFMLVTTPSGLALAPEGGGHQSVGTPLMTLGQPGLEAFEPAFADETAAIMAWGFEHMQKPPGKNGGASVSLRLCTRPIAQPARVLSDALRKDIVAGGYWLHEPQPGAELAIAFSGSVAPEAQTAFETILEDIPGAGVLNVTSADRLHKGWTAASRARQKGEGAPCHLESLLAPLAEDAAIVTVLDGHPSGLGWIGAAGRYRVYPLGVEDFGQCGDIPDLYRHYRIDAEAILDAAAAACLRRRS